MKNDMVEGNVILIIDDDEITLEVMKVILEKSLSCRVKMATNGVNGLEILRRHPICLVLLDMDMPFMSGLEMLQQMRSVEAFQKIPVIMMADTADSLRTVLCLAPFLY